jgi:SulP family sulfate permease
MPKRYLDLLAQARARLGYGLRACLREGYGKADLRADLMAGVVVGIVALPLSMALAIASGVPPQHGLYTAIVAGIVCPLLGGTRCQVTGPTAAFVVILAPIVAKFGLGGLLCAGLLAGCILVALGAAKLGELIQFVPHPVTTGFTSGIAVVIATIQLKDFLGLQLAGSPESYLDRWRLMWQARATLSLPELALGLGTLALLIALPRMSKRLPAPLLALGLAAVAARAISRLVPGLAIATIGSRFHGIPAVPPTPILPWHMAGPASAPFHIDFAMIQALLPAAFAIAMLGAIESLLAAVVSDGMSGTRHDPNAELVALGIGNILCPFFGGIAATGALARTATNIRAGGRSPFASVIHALFVLLSTVLLAPLVSYIPMAALAALLLLVAKNMAEARHFAHIVRVAPRSDMIVLLVCFALTVIFDMVWAVSAGVVLASLLFMRRMAELTDVKLATGHMAKLDLPDDVKLYEIAGPLFFGAAQKAMSISTALGDRRQAVILYLGQVPAIDATGLVALETLLTKLKKSGHKVILAGLNPQPAGVLARAGIVPERGRLAIAPDLDSALSVAIMALARQGTGVAGPSAAAAG